MPSSVIGALRVNLGLDSAEFTRGATQAEKRAETMGRKIGTALRSPIDAAISLKGALGALGGALLVNELAQATARALDFADAIADLSDRTGASAKTIQEFRYAAQVSGSSVETADEALGKFTRTLGLAQAGSKAQANLFKELGVTSSDFETAFRQTLDGLAKLPTVQQRNAVALQIFGKSAGTLTGLLGQGSKGFEQLAERARELGIVLSEDVIRNAGQANDKLDTMKMILNAQFANVVAQNAGSLFALANGIGQVATAITKFLSSNPELALSVLGGLAGARVAGIPGAIGGASVGYLGGQRIAKARDDGNGNASFRVKQLRNAIAYSRVTRGDPNDPRSEQGKALAEVRRQQGLAQAAIKRGQKPRAAVTIAAAGGILPPAVGGGGGRSKAGGKDPAAEAKRLAEEANRKEERYQSDLFRSKNELQSLQADLTVEAAERAQFERDRIEQDRAYNQQAIQNDKDLTEAQKAKLIALEGQIAGEKTRKVYIDETEAAARDELESVRARSDNETEILQAQSSLARTAKERRDIEMRILAAQFDQLRAVEQATLESLTATGEQKRRAQERIGTLNKTEGFAQQRLSRDNQGPLGQFFDTIPKSADEVNEALERVAADGLGSLTDGFADAISGARSLADVMNNVANQIIQSLIRIAIQKAIVGALGSALGGGGGFNFGASAAGAKAAGSFLTLPAANFGGARAAGGPVVGGKSYLVGEKGMEIFTPSRSGSIVSNDNITGGGGRWIIEPSPYFDVRAASAARPETQAMGVKAAAGGAQIAQSRSSKAARRRLGN